MPKSTKLKLLLFIPSEPSLSSDAFTFLNQKKVFSEANIEWDFPGYGLLWNYNLNYFEFLNQENLSAESGIKLIYHFIDNAKIRSASYDPYPVSLRGINWIKFLVKNNIDDPKIDESLFRQYVKLSYETEKHLGANHLLENGFSLLFAAFYFNDKKFFEKAENILFNELQEQILDDGAHFELSTMYHRIILNRILDCINLVKNNNAENNALQKLLEEKAMAMLSWMSSMTFRNGETPHFNDSAQSIAPTPRQLTAYARQLDIYPNNISSSESGFKKFSFQKYELILDAADIMPSYNPGHTHADMLSFCLNIHESPVIVHCGTSTYENNSRRKYERSTEAHNTVSVNGLEQSDVWASFRVGRRARIISRSFKENYFSSAMKGFTSAGIIHKREWEFSENKIIITDSVSGNSPRCKAFLHFHPDVSVEQKGDSLSGNNFAIAFRTHSNLSLESYDFAEGFNLLVKAKVAIILFSGRLYTEILL